MKRSTFLLGAAALALTACAGAPPPTTLGPDGKPLPKLYRIGPGDKAQIQFRMLDAINALRQAKGVAPLELNSRLTAAAATHARDMSAQNRPWHFGSDGSSPITRIQRAGYDGRLVGEAISETYETELETLGAWMDAPNTRTVILDPTARDMGFSWYQESNGKIWWNLVLGAPGESGFIPVNAPA
ncbi:CAP domain-containing protein [Marivita sp. GX14005]|uniref:CAP domain-containing protein n=1 Tax=Marivita sp. GX14005 TaxID=2942276 RepID=UPI002019E496|nr:CAP domain-containing protein [Marivita sp. GX14005]MCL3881611.1 CAP domain-containing protein [Marivita sp. GX14005]